MRSPDLEEVGVPGYDDAEYLEGTAVVVKKTTRALIEEGKLAIDQQDLVKHAHLVEWSRKDLRGRCQHRHRR